jgi:hypothetical protein
LDGANGPNTIAKLALGDLQKGSPDFLKVEALIQDFVLFIASFKNGLTDDLFAVTKCGTLRTNSLLLSKYACHGTGIDFARTMIWLTVVGPLLLMIGACMFGYNRCPPKKKKERKLNVVYPDPWADVREKSVIESDPRGRILGPRGKQ